MIFSLVSSAQEWLNVKWDDYKREEESRAQQKLKELEEVERVSVQQSRLKLIAEYTNAYWFTQNCSKSSRELVLRLKRSWNGATSMNVTLA